MASRGGKGFTLIEILVVIAIIALLASLLLPSLSRSREYAKEVACMNNLRQAAIAFNGYMVDNKSQMPFTTSPGTGSPGYFRFLDDMTPAYASAGRSAKIFKCPSSKSPPMSYERLASFKTDYLCGGDIADIELKSLKNNGHGNNVYSFDPSNPSPGTQSAVANKKPQASNCNQRALYERGYGWHRARRAIVVASIDDLHCYVETKSLLPYWMLNDSGKIVTSTLDWPDLGPWPAP
jgi:prepilin-type N-terminal cleavage/methylation domain-containing protein